MAYGTANVDNIQSSTSGTPTVFKDGSGTQIGTLCRAWVNFNGTGTVAIKASFNVSSITDNGTGDYTVNFTTAMPDANYASPSQGGSLFGGATPSTKTTTAYRLLTYNTSSVATDYADISVAIFR
jgi:hypothetical protein